MIGNAEATTTLAVTDLKKAREFYGKTLGLQEVRVELPRKDGVVYRAGNAYICVYERPTPSGSTATACSFEVKDVAATVKALQKDGVRFEEYDLPEMGIRTKNGIASMGDFQTAWFKDPDGNILAIGNSLMNVIQKADKTPIVKAH